MMSKRDGYMHNTHNMTGNRVKRDKITRVIKCFRSLRADYDESGGAEYRHKTMNTVEKINRISDGKLVTVRDLNQSIIRQRVEYGR